MNKLAMHPATDRALKSFIARPSHAVLLTGARGIGKASLATYLSESLLGIQVESLAGYAYVRRITSVDNKVIGIEPVRELEHFLSLKVPGNQNIKRIVIIEDGQLLGLEAQNALLKTLEEPPADTVIIITATTPQALLPTIQSRLQTINVSKPSKANLQAILPSPKFDTVYALAGGLPGLIHALLIEESHPLAEAVSTARLLLGQSSYERLLQVDALSKDKQLTIDTLTILQQMAEISLQTASGPASRRWQAILRASYETAAALQASANSKLVLTSLLLQL